MFTRVVEITSKPGKARELSRTISDKVLTILKNQPGFVDEILLMSADSQDRLLALSFWNTSEDAQKYNREQFPKVTELMKNLIEGQPQVRTYNVDQSTVHNIGARKAA
jgi:heme-degrading monooxygenase HmoA